jgi:hypothetical protein
MAKAKKAKQSTQLPLDDMLRWRPVAEIAKRLLPHIGNKSLIAQDLTEALASEKIHCMCRRPAGRELLPASFWTEYYLECLPNGGIGAARCPPPNQYGPLSIFNGVFYLWQPDCVEVWPALTPQEIDASEAEASESPSPRRKPGRKPKEDWKLFVAAKLWEMRKAGQRVPPAADFAQLCENELRYQPDISEIQKWLRQLG